MDQMTKISKQFISKFILLMSSQETLIIRLAKSSSNTLIGLR